MFGAFAASTGSLGVTVGNVQRPATVSFGLRASPQLTALFTSAAILFSSAAGNSVRAHEVGHMVPSSRFAASWKPNVEYLKLYFCALWKKQTILPSLLAYAGIPYQVFGDRSGALALMIAWSRSAMARSGSGISAIFASTSRSPAALSLSARASAFSSLARSFIAACSSAVNPSYFLLVTVVRLADLRAPLVAVLLSATTKHLFRTAQRCSGSRVVVICTPWPPPSSGAPPSSWAVFARWPRRPSHRHVSARQCDDGARP